MTRRVQTEAWPVLLHLMRHGVPQQGKPVYPSGDDVQAGQHSRLLHFAILQPRLLLGSVFPIMMPDGLGFFFPFLPSCVPIRFWILLRSVSSMAFRTHVNNLS